MTSPLTGPLAALRAILRSSLSSTAKVVAMGMVDHWSAASPQPHPALETLATYASASRSSVIRSIRELETAGAIRVVRAHGRSNRYDLTPLMGGTFAYPCQGDTRVRVEPVSHGHPTSVRVTPHPCHSDTPTSVRVTPEVTQLSNPVSNQVSDPGGADAPRTPHPAAAEDHKDQDRDLDLVAVSRSGRELPPRPPKRTRRAPKPTTTIPADWAPSDRHRDYATERGLDLARCMIAFVGHAESTGRECVSWDGAFTTWLAKERGDDHRGSRPRPTGPAHAPTFDASQTGFR